MAPTVPDKRLLDSQQASSTTLRVRQTGLLLALALVFGSQPAEGQVPAAADLWRVSAATIAGPPALERGTTASFWNPAAVPEGRWSAGVQLVQTSDVLGISSALGGVTYAVNPALRVNLIVGRTDIGDLSRTTTSPASEPGTIPIYEQLAGLGASLKLGAVHLGLLLGGHDARFDADRERGLTADGGIRIGLGSRLTVAGATHFFPLDLTGREHTDYHLGLEYSVATPAIWGAPGELAARYGLTYREGAAGGLEQGVGLGCSVNRGFAVAMHLVREVGYGTAAWRPTFEVRLKVGRYTIAAARAWGLNDIGASYRVALDLELER